MQLNLRKEKGLTIENVRTIIQLGINYGEKLNALEATCIEEYKSLDHSYLPGDHCFYGGYLYECIATASGEWNPTRWKKVGDDLTPVTKADIEALIGLSAEEIQTLASIILDTEIRIDKTYSSSKIYTDIQQCLHDSKTFTLRQLSNTKMPHYSVVGSVDDVTEEGVLYLVKRSDSNICDIYAFISNAPQSLTTTEINLDNIYTKTEVDELLDKKADKATTMPSDKIITNVDDATTDNILSASTTLEAIDNKITESIVTTLDENTTDTQIPSAKTVYELSNDKNIKTYCYLSQLGLQSGCSVVDIYNAMGDGTIATIAVIGGSCPDAPGSDGVLIIEKQGIGKANIMFKRSHNSSVAPNTLYIGSLKGSDGSGLVWNDLLSSLNLITELTTASTNTQLLGAKTLYNIVTDIQNQLNILCPKLDWSSKYINNTSITSFTPSSDDLNKFVTNVQSMFEGCTSLTSIDMSTLNGGLIESYHNFARNCSVLETVNLASFISPYATSMTNMFNSCTKLKTLVLPDLSTNKIKSAQSCFYKCTSLTSINLSKLNTSNFNSMVSMFDYCSSLTSLDVSHFDTSQVTNCAWMFSNCAKLSTLDVSNFNTSKMTNIEGMFYGCRLITSLDLSNFDTSNVINMNTLVSTCIKLTTLKLGSKFITTKCSKYDGIFTNCTALKTIQIPSNFPAESKTFLEARLSDAGIKNNVTFQTY